MKIKKDFEGKKPNITIMSAAQTRGGMFLPVSKSVHISKEIKIYIYKNVWQEVTIEGIPLNQTHQDIIEAIFYVSEEIKKFSDGCLGIKFLPGKVLEVLEIKGENYTWLHGKIKEIMLNVITVKKNNDNDPMPPINHIISEFNNSNEKTTKKLPTGKILTYKFIVFSKQFVNFINKDISLFYRDLIPDIISLQYPILKSLVRFCLSHKKLNMSISEFLRNIHINKSCERYKRKLINQIKINEYSLNKFGIKIKEIKTGEHAGELGIFYERKDILIKHNNKCSIYKPLQASGTNIMPERN